MRNVMKYIVNKAWDDVMNEDFATKSYRNFFDMRMD